MSICGKVYWKLLLMFITFHYMACVLTDTEKPSRLLLRGLAIVQISSF